MGGFLSRMGKKVLVLEQHYIAGGTMHSFDYKGIEHETGIHYVGRIQKRKPVLDFICDKPIEWDILGIRENNVYDKIFIEDMHYKLRACEVNFINDLSKRFPRERANITNYVALIKSVSSKTIF